LENPKSVHRCQWSAPKTDPLAALATASPISWS